MTTTTKARSKAKAPKASDVEAAAASPPVSPAAAAPSPAEPAASPKSPNGKLGALVALMQRPQGADISDMMRATGWQAHSVRGAMAGALKKKFALAITSQKSDAGRIYRIAQAPMAQADAQ